MQKQTKANAAEAVRKWLRSVLVCGAAVVVVAAMATLVGCQISKENETDSATQTTPTTAVATEAPTEPETQPTAATEPETVPETATETELVSETETATEADTTPETETETETETGTETATEAGSTTIPTISLDQVTDVTLPENSKTFSWTLAQQLLGLCTGNTQEGTAARFAQAGFEDVLHQNYDKPDSDTSHTSAYSVGKRVMTVHGEERTVLLVSIRGTNAGEWYSNMDFAPSLDPNTAFAENFYQAAQDIYAGLKTVLEQETDPVILVSGHSRGAACAGLLGLLLNTDRGLDDVYVYTFASPNTVRETPSVDCSNIFNIINPADPVTVTPVSALGFFRAGKDILLSGDPDAVAQAQTLPDAIGALSSTIPGYYNDKHSLTSAGLSEDGITAYEVAEMLAANFIGGSDASAAQLKLLSVARASESSDLYPFAQLIRSLFLSGNSSALFANHMPEVYLGLMAAASVAQ